MVFDSEVLVYCLLNRVQEAYITQNLFMLNLENSPCEQAAVV